MKRCLFNEIAEGFGCLERRRHRVCWHAKNHHLIATRGGITVSVPVPVDGFYTDAKNWLETFQPCVKLAKVKMDREEWRQRV